MNVIAIDGSPRKHFNTATLVDSLLEGVKDVCPAANTEHVHLYDLNYKGCVSCMGCKINNSRFYGHCVHKDDITPVIERVSETDILILASPVYFGDITGAMHCFLERLLFPYETYETSHRTIAPHRMPVVTIYTMNTRKEAFFQRGYNVSLDMIERFISNLFTKPQRLCSYNTCQVKDYSRYRIETYSEADKLKYKAEHWEQDKEAARQTGRKIVASFRQDISENQ